jgi:hypothetical protein
MQVFLTQIKMLRPAVCEKDKETALLVDEGPKSVDRHARHWRAKLTCGERSPRAYPLVVGVMALVLTISFCLDPFLDIPVERAATEAAARASML